MTARLRLPRAQYFPSKEPALLEVREAFHRAGLRHTRQREAVYAALCASSAHPTAEELHELVRGGDPGLSLATVYNTLDALCNAGLCRRLPNVSAGCRFDADLSDHVHLVLPDGRVLDLPPEVSREVLHALPPALAARIASTTGFPLVSLGVQLIAHPADSPT
ncbi:MAG: transcriptional repressor [Phycisphaerales bacterium]|nr:transcriptional repressor [Phycisphaerales bacterium]